MSGAPGMPTSDPRLARSIAEALTSSGSSATPVINRAEARFSAGWMVSPMRTYSAPDSRAMTIAASPDVASWLQEREYRARRDRDGRQNAPGDQRKRLCA